MAVYRVWLTVKDSYGNTKEVDGGTINVDLAALTPSEVDQIEEALPLENYLKKSEIDAELEHYATDVELEHAVEHNDAIKYSDFELKPEE